MKSYSATAIQTALDRLLSEQRAGGTVATISLTLLEDALNLINDRGWRSLHADQVSTSTRRVLEEFVEPVP